MISPLSIPEGRSNASKIAVPELALDEMSGTPFVGHLDGVGVPELMGRETPPNAGFRSCPPKVGACGCRRPRPPTRGAVDDAERWADREMEAHVKPRLQMFPGPLIHADLAAAAALPAAHEQRASAPVEVKLGSARAAWKRSPARQSTTMKAGNPTSVAAVAGSAHHGDDLLDGRPIYRVAVSLVSWRATGVEPGIGARDRRRRGSIEQQLGHDPSSGSKT